MEIWNRGTLELRRSRPLLYTSRLESISGRWALLDSTRLSDSDERQSVVWDLENGMVCSGNIDPSEAGSCFHQVNEERAIVYTATENTDEAGVSE
jgi:hypothetical protein